MRGGVRNQAFSGHKLYLEGVETPVSYKIVGEA